MHIHHALDLGLDDGENFVNVNKKVFFLSHFLNIKVILTSKIKHCSWAMFLVHGKLGTTVILTL